MTVAVLDRDAHDDEDKEEHDEDEEVDEKGRCDVQFGRQQTTTKWLMYLSFGVAY